MAREGEPIPKRKVIVRKVVRDFTKQAASPTRLDQAIKESRGAGGFSSYQDRPAHRISVSETTRSETERTYNGQFEEPIENIDSEI